MRLFSQRRRLSGSRERGYIMMMLLLTIALMIIMAAAIAPTIAFEIRRDREEEMIHRGVQYSRAIRMYYKKFARYPTKIEDLENTNQLRFLRKRYKDPLTGKDFKVLHFGEAKMSMNGVGGGVIPGASTLGTNGSLNSPNGLTQNSTFGNSGFGNNSFGSSGFGGNSSFGSNSAFGQNSQNAGAQGTGSDSTPANSDPSQSGSTQGGSSADGASPANGQGTNDKLANTTFGGAPIVGVASTSKDRTIREYDHKKKYNEWQFVYDPTFDRGMLITTPYQPQLQQFGMQGTTNLNGQPTNGQNGNNGFGNSFGNGFGSGTFGSSPSGPQNSPTSPNSGGFGNPTQPSNQQQ